MKHGPATRTEHQWNSHSFIIIIITESQEAITGFYPDPARYISQLQNIKSSYALFFYTLQVHHRAHKSQSLSPIRTTDFLSLQNDLLLHRSYKHVYIPYS
jgi:hypothetical protein